MNGALLFAAANMRDGYAMAMRMPEVNRVRFKLRFDNVLDDFACVDAYLKRLENFIKSDRVVGYNSQPKMSSMVSSDDDENSIISLIEVNRSAASLVTSFLNSNRHAVDVHGVRHIVRAGVKTTPTHGEKKHRSQW